MIIREAHERDHGAIWEIIRPVIRAGETYTLDRDLSRSEALAYWLGKDKETFIAEDQGQIVGTYYLKANQSGGGSHVCNCGYMIDEAASGRGIARAMHAHSLEFAKGRGFRAMQFNFVISTNERAVRLWKSLGFDEVGRLPGAFLHPVKGYVDALVMYRAL